MKRVSSKTNTFGSLIKFLTFMLGFIFIGVMHADKVDAAVFKKSDTESISLASSEGSAPTVELNNTSIFTGTKENSNYTNTKAKGTMKFTMETENMLMSVVMTINGKSATKTVNKTDTIAVNIQFTSELNDNDTINYEDNIFYVPQSYVPNSGTVTVKFVVKYQAWMWTDTYTRYAKIKRGSNAFWDTDEPDVSVVFWDYEKYSTTYGTVKKPSFSIDIDDTKSQIKPVTFYGCLSTKSNPSSVNDCSYKYQYSIGAGYEWENDGSWEIGTSNAISGTYYLSFTEPISDYMGNSVSAFTVFKTYKIDHVAPTTSVSISNSSGGNWTTDDVTLTFSGSSDGLSGVFYTFSGATASSSTANTATFSSDMNATVSVTKVCDDLGNCNTISNTSTNVKIDKTAPSVTSVAITNSANGNWTNGSVTLTFSGASDSGSGVNSYSYTGGTPNSTSGNSITFTQEMNINISVISVCDNVGNCADVSGVSSSVKIDKTAPQITITQNISEWSKEKIVTVRTTDDASGVYSSSVSYYITTSSTGHGSTYISPYSYIPSSKLDSCTLVNDVCELTYEGYTGTYYLFVNRIRDNAGNYSDYDYQTKMYVTETYTDSSITVTPGTGTSTNCLLNPNAVGCGTSITPSIGGGTTCASNPLLCGGSVVTPTPGITTPVQPGYSGGVTMGGLSYTEDEDDGHTNIAAGTQEVLKGTYYFIKSSQILMDNTGPSISSVALTNSSSGNWTTLDVTIGFSGASDVHSGVGMYHFTGATFTTATGAIEFKEEMNIVIALVKVCDVLENCSNVTASVSTPVRIDRSAPTLTSSNVYNSSSQEWTNDEVVGLNLPMATDSLSGINVHQYSLNGTDWINITTQQTETAQATMGFTAEQESLVRTRVCDNVGNCQAYNSTYVKIDRTKPNKPSVDNPKDGVWTNQDVTVNLTGGADNLGTYNSGFKQYVYDANVGNNASTKFTQEQDRVYTIVACDNAGNCSAAATTTVKIDKTAPNKPSVDNPKDGVWTNGNVVVTTTGGADNLGSVNSGLYTYKYKKSSASSYSTVGSSITFNKEQNTTYNWIACDKAGNCSDEIEVVSTTIKIDKTAPDKSINVNTTNKRATISFVDNKGTVNSGISNSNSKIGSNYSYYISKNEYLDVTALNEWINPGVDTSKGSNAYMNLSDGTYYLYVRIKNSEVVDKAGNSISGAIAYHKDSEYTVFKQKVEGSENVNTTSINEAAINNSNATVSEAHDIQIYAESKMITITFNSEETLDFSLASINKVLEYSNYKILSLNDSSVAEFENSYIYQNALVIQKDTNNKSGQNEFYDLVIIINGPETVAIGNTPNKAVSTFIKGEELGNVGVSFIDEENLEIETQITLDGVLVKKVDSNKAGTYAIRVVAKDASGRINKIERLIIVEDNEEVKEVAAPKELIVAPVQHVEVSQEQVKEIDTSRKVVEVKNVEMRVEKKEEVKVSKKKNKKEERKNKEENKFEVKELMNVLNNNYTYRNKV